MILTDKLILTSENYFSPEASRLYLSVSQYKDFVGTLGRVACEAQAMAKLNELWKMEMSTALLVGSYVDSHFEGTLGVFRAQNPDIFTQKGTLKADYKKAEEIINRIENDALFMQYMSGEKQIIMTANMFGVDWKCKMDSYHKGVCIVDLKVMKAIRESNYVRDYGHMNFIQYWGYDIQAAVYQNIEYLNRLAKCTTEEEKENCQKLPFFIAVASKEKETDIEIIAIEQNLMDDALIGVETNIHKIIALKNKEIDPIRCGVCDYCKHTKVLTGPIWSTDLLGEV